MKNSDEAIDRALARLREAEVPEGMEERIAARLAMHTDMRNAAFRWREVFAGSALAGVWWRGALSGIAVAAMVMGVVWLAGWHARWPGRSSENVVREQVIAGPPSAATAGVPLEEVSSGAPCVNAPRVVRDSDAERRRELVRLAKAEIERSHPAPALGLTAQERELVQLARTGDVKDLIALDPEMRAKAEAKDAAEFQRFFAEPVRGETAPAPQADNE